MEITKTPRFELGQQTCTECNKTDYDNVFEKTTDNKDVCIKCLSEAQDYYKKGLLSSEEVSKYFKLKELYKLKVNEISLQVRKYAKYYETSDIELMKDVIRLETSLSERTFKKGKGFGTRTIVSSIEEINGVLSVTIDEHLAIINQVLENFDLIAKIIPEEEYSKLVISRGVSNSEFNNFIERNYVVL